MAKCWLLALVAQGLWLPAIAAAAPPNLVLITLDTTRADHLGAYGSHRARTPNLDALAADGVVFRRAISASPLTLPAHASLMTGLLPAEHAATANGTTRLDTGVPVLAEILAARGYATAAFIASRVLDRRFGLDRGFDLYDDAMTAENLGEYGYPERDAQAVTDVALAWLSEVPEDQAFFAWIHFYDPHAPYAPPPPYYGGDASDRYDGEIAYVDSEIGRLRRALESRSRSSLIAVVGDHGESFGEHGERGHGIFLYREAVEVPLILAGPGVPAARWVERPVATRRLAPTLLQLIGVDDLPPEMGSPLPGIQSGEDPGPVPIYSESDLPRTAYGWAPLRAITDGRWRFIEAPRPELYDIQEDPTERVNRIDDQLEVADRLRDRLTDTVSSFDVREASTVELDPELRAALRSLGYVKSSSPASTNIDPKDGIALLAKIDHARDLLRTGETEAAAESLRRLVQENPENLSLLNVLAQTQSAQGQWESALATRQRAVAINPGLDFLHLHLADTYLATGEVAQARDSYERVLELNPRSATAWLRLAEMAKNDGQAGLERRLLAGAVAVGTNSAAVHLRLGQLEAAAGNGQEAASHLERATSLAPSWTLVWIVRGDLANERGDSKEAVAAYSRAAALAPDSSAPLLRLGRLYLALGDLAQARSYLQRVIAVAPRTADATEAGKLLAGL